MLVMRLVLASKGYAAAAWGLGTNIGPQRHVIDGMNRRLEDRYQAHGRKVTIVGWSLGGMYARARRTRVMHFTVADANE